MGTPQVRSRRREQILEVAADLIAHGGLSTSLTQITEAAEILPGSLYHHFGSKADILVELMRRYHADLDTLAAQTQEEIDRPGHTPGPAGLVALGTRIAGCATRHRAAVQLTFYETPGAAPELIELARRPPSALNHAMRDTLRAMRWSGSLRPDVDLAVVADRICQTLLQVGLDVLPGAEPPGEVVRALAGILLDGLARTDLEDARLDTSAAFTAADEVVRDWIDHPRTDREDVDTAGRVRSAAVAEFARRGFETTTLRDIAAAAGVGVGTVHRLIGSKDEVLAATMRAFGERVAGGWQTIFATDSSPLEQLDAMMWININTVFHFPDEFRIQLAWLRHRPPGATEPGWSFSRQLGLLAQVLTRGIELGELDDGGLAVPSLTRSVISVQWIPENILEALGPREAQRLARDTVLHGLTVRSS